MEPLPAALPIEPRGPVDAVVQVPGSKSITNRALLIAALADGQSRLMGALTSIDTDVMRAALGQLGASVVAGQDVGDAWTVSGVAGRWSAPASELFMENSGTSTRFLTAAAALAPGPVILDGSPRMRERPIRDLVDALRGLGVRIDILGKEGCPPVRVHGGGLPGGSVQIDASQSSQYVSAVLLAAPYARKDVLLRFLGGELVSRPYVDLTLEVMRAFGADAGWTEEGHVSVRAGRPYVARDYAIEPDASSAAYPFVAAAITGGVVVVEGIPPDTAQADFKILGLLERMGCEVAYRARSVEVRGPQTGLKSLGEVDMNDLPDAVLAYAVAALFANGPTLITNVGNLRIKETDRLAALETELRRLGARAEAGEDWLKISPGPVHGAEIETYDDHRMAMAFALAGLKIPGVVIRDPACVSKTWPNFFDALRHL